MRYNQSETGVVVAVTLALSLGTAAIASNGIDHLIKLPDGRRLHISCSGTGAPTVILESGLGLPLVAWGKVKSRLASHYRVCGYDRAGYVPSDSGPMPRDATNVVADLNSWIRAERLSPPYILVGHSLGADFVLLFAADHRDEVGGLVLVDPDFREADEKLSAASPVTKEVITANNLTMERCVGAVASGRFWSAGEERYARCGPPPSPGSPLASRSMAQATLSEFHSREINEAEIASATHSSLTVPMIVLTADGKRGPLAEVREQAAIAKTSKRGVQRMVADSGHVIQFDRPDEVVQAVEDVIAMDGSKPKSLTLPPSN